MGEKNKKKKRKKEKKEEKEKKKEKKFFPLPSKTMGCFSGRLMSAASDQKLFCPSLSCYPLRTQPEGACLQPTRKSS